MSERTYHTKDKSDWGHGPWTDEPDKIQWIDEATGLDCLIVRNPGGALCGYVGLPPGHPWHGIGYSDCAADERDSGCDREWSFCDHTPEAGADVHGGLTYSDRCQPSEDESRGICHAPEPGRPEDVWWFGFDCAHSGDISPKWHDGPRGWDTYKDVGYVRHEVRRLAKQLAEVGT